MGESMILHWYKYCIKFISIICPPMQRFNLTSSHCTQPRVGSWISHKCRSPKRVETVTGQWRLWSQTCPERCKHRLWRSRYWRLGLSTPSPHCPDISTPWNCTASGKLQLWFLWKSYQATIRPTKELQNRARKKSCLWTRSKSRKQLLLWEQK